MADESVCMQDMPGAGGMKMYSREDLTNNPDLVGGGPEVSDDDDEDEDDDSDDDVDFQNLVCEFFSSWWIWARGFGSLSNSCSWDTL